MALTLPVGSIIWFFTLTERADFEKVWMEQNGEVQPLLQDSASLLRLDRLSSFSTDSSGLIFHSTALLLWLLER